MRAHLVDHRADHRSRQRGAAVRAAVIAGLEHGGDVALGPRRPDRKAVAHRLGHRDDIGHDPGVLEPEPLPGAPEAGLDLVDHQQQTALVAQRTHVAQVLIVGRQHAALTLHRLEQDGGDAGIDRCLERGDVVEDHVPEPVGHREERLVLGRLAGGRQARPACGRGSCRRH